ncbi:hypothetical protein AB2T19_003324 [Clostridium botulinum]
MDIKNLYIDQGIILETFDSVLNNSNSVQQNFLKDIRNSLRINIIKEFTKQGINFNSDQSVSKINFNKSVVKPTLAYNYNDVRECYRWGFDYYSLTAINYLLKNYVPSLKLLTSENNFSLGNLSFVVENASYEININFCDKIMIKGYSYEISPRKKKSNFCLYDIKINSSFLRKHYKKYIDMCHCNTNDLIESDIAEFPAIFVCRICGKLYVCRCFEGWYNYEFDINRKVYTKPDSLLEKMLPNIKIKDNICYLCTDKKVKLSYTKSIFSYTSPYYNLFERKNPNKSSKEIENMIRQKFGYPKIGEKWISETTLFKVVRTIFPDKEVIFHYRGKELEGLELDIWIPEIKLGIEYQGIQHYKPIDCWGGEDSLLKQKENDKRKKIICKTLGYDLIEVKYNENIDIETIEKKLLKYI